MNKYPDFMKDIIEENISENNIDDKEKYYIEFFNSFHDINPKGLNLTQGGNGSKKMSKLACKKLSENHKGKHNSPHTEFKKGNKLGKDTSRKIYQYSAEGLFIKEWNSIMEALRFYNLNERDSSLTRCANIGEMRLNFQWRFYKTDKIAPKKQRQLKRKVKLIDMETNEEILFNSCRELCKYLNISDKNINRYIKNKSIVKKKYIIKEVKDGVEES